MPSLLLLPHQLFAPSHPLFQSVEEVMLWEHPLFFQESFHPFKKILARASMKAYAKELEGAGLKLRYFAHDEKPALPEALEMFHPSDTWVLQDIQKRAPKLTLHEGPDFFWRPLMDEAREPYPAHSKEKPKIPLMASYYQKQRRHFGYLMDEEGKPLGGQWSFDSENRKKLPSATMLCPWPFGEQTQRAILEEATLSLGYELRLLEHFHYPITREEALAHLELFIQERLSFFGAFEDAFEASQNFLYHSLLSVPLNMGLLSPREICDRAMQAFHENPALYPLASVEGFIRQILGWREYVHEIYLKYGSWQRNQNFFEHQGSLKNLWADAPPAIAEAKNRTERYAYTHHIERLMVLGNWFFLNKIHPHAVYQWFMDFFVDGYDWVMVPNVYGMSQYADGGMMTSKPYLCGSNYLFKMSHYPKDARYEKLDALYWTFIAEKEDFFSKNPRLSMMPKLYAKMSPEKKARFEEVVKGGVKRKIPYCRIF